MRNILIQLVAVLPLISCWKPLTSHPSAFSVHQSYPASGGGGNIARKSANELVYGSDTIADSSIVDSFHKNDFRDEPVSVQRFNNAGFFNPKALHFDSFNNFHGYIHEVSRRRESLVSLFLCAVLITLCAFAGDTFEIHSSALLLFIRILL
jgi:hypothetical protein